MGVQGLWRVLEPTAKPVQLANLRGKVLAIDASIWIYHFLKAMRDSKGTILAAAHIIGFFRRICKLLFFEIRPVFVFDGAAPILKKQTTQKRGERRQGREVNARATANKLLTLQLQRAAQQETHTESPRNSVKVTGSVPADAVYMEDLAQPKESQRGADPPNFVRMDQYHLPEISKIAPLSSSDQRMLSEEELQEYSRNFSAQARAGFIDTSTVDFQSTEFQQLPIETQYQLLNMARLKSRLRMGYTAEELEQMFPNEMDFSRFQINRVAQRNFFTQRLMNLVGLEEDLTRRVSSEKNKEYMLKRNDEGWTLSLEDSTKGPAAKDNSQTLSAGPLDSAAAGPLDGGAPLAEEQRVKRESSDDENDDEFEDVDIQPSEQNKGDHARALDPPPENVELTAEDSAQLDELFGFEAKLSRENLYHKMMQEVDSAENQSSVHPSTKAKDWKPRSFLFGSSSGAKRIQPSGEKANPEPAQPAQPQAAPLPWFDNTDNNFQEMQIQNTREDPNIVPYEELSDYSEAEEPMEEVDLSQESLVETAKERQPADVDTGANYGTDIESSGPHSSPAVAPSDSSEQLQSEKAKAATNERSTNVISETDVKHHPVSALTDPTAESQEPKAALETTISAESPSTVPSKAGSASAGGDTDFLEPVEQAERPFPTEPSSALERDSVLESAVAELGSNKSPLGVETEQTSAQPRPVAVTPESTESRLSEVDAGISEPVQLSPEAAERAEEEAKADVDEDEEIAAMLIAEAEENERFAKELAEQNHKAWTDADQADYNDQISTLRTQFAKETRDADTVTQEMIQECQELLQFFGIPYITAPGEAEAQCAELRHLKLVDGVVTDDGDTFLFDDNAIVYRNMFSQSRFVECYTTEQIHNKIGLNRRRLIDMAFLLGSDYTEGLLGIGPVTSVEVLAEFGSLEEFAKWWNHAQRFPDDAGLETPLKRRLFKQFRTKLFLPEDFPSQVVIDAYLHPTVDRDATRFKWGVPDIDGLRKFMNVSAGWSIEKINTSLLPVVQEAKRRELQHKTGAAVSQSSLDDYYSTVVHNPEVLSKRAARATTALRKRAKKQKQT